MSYTKHLYFSDFLKAFSEEAQAKNKSFSIRALSKKLGYKNPSLINDVIRKKRKPSLDLVIRLSEAFHFPRAKKEYLSLICEYEKAKTFGEKEKVLSEIRAFLKERSWEVFDLTKYDLLVKPNVFLIYSLIALKDFKPTTQYLNKKLKFKLSQKEINSCLKTLVDSGFIVSKGKNKYDYSKQQSVLSGGDAGIESQAVMSFHINMMSLVQKIFTQTKPSDRDVRSTTLAIKASDFKSITDQIVKMHQKIMTFGVDSDADDAYIFSSQLIPFTQKKSE